jgi:hypothetical protein
MPRLQLCFLALLGLLAGCATTHVESNLSDEWTGHLDEVFVVAEVASDWSSEDAATLGTLLERELALHCPRFAVRVLGGLSLEQPDVAEEVERSGMTHVLALTQTMTRTRDQGFGMRSHAGFVFDAQLIRVLDRKPLWRANLDTGGNASDLRTYGESLASDLVERMIADGLLVENAGDLANQPPPPGEDYREL